MSALFSVPPLHLQGQFYVQCLYCDGDTIPVDSFVFITNASNARVRLSAVSGRFELEFTLDGLTRQEDYDCQPDALRRMADVLDNKVAWLEFAQNVRPGNYIANPLRQLP